APRAALFGGERVRGLDGTDLLARRSAHSSLRTSRLPSRPASARRGRGRGASAGSPAARAPVRAFVPAPPPRAPVPGSWMRARERLFGARAAFARPRISSLTPPLPPS